jgi:hypothetical protein
LEGAAAVVSSMVWMPHTSELGATEAGITRQTHSPHCSRLLLLVSSFSCFFFFKFLLNFLLCFSKDVATMRNRGRDRPTPGITQHLIIIIAAVFFG